MKKIISIMLLVVMAATICCADAFAASDAYKVTWTLKASVMDPSASQKTDRTNFVNATNKKVYSGADGDVICVYPGQVVWATVNLKTGSSFYAGEVATNVFYTTNIFVSTSESGNSYVWNRAGKFTSISEGLGAPFSKLTNSYKDTNYPPSWSAQQRNAHGMYSALLLPNFNATKTAVSNINEDLVSVPIYVKSNAAVGSTGSIFFPEENLRTTSNKTGRFFVAHYENGDLLKTPVTYSDKFSFDLSGAKLAFVVCSKKATGVSIAEDSLDMNYKSTKKLSATVKGDSSVKPIWSTSNPKVATVDANGNVTATGRGSAVITASYGSFSDSCSVTVNYSFGQWLIKILLFGWIWY